MRVAIIGGGVAGLTAAWQLDRLARAGAQVQTTLYEASNRLGGIIQTVREGGFTIETGPDAWLTAKPSASELAHDLGLSDEVLPSNDSARKTWVLLRTSARPAGQLVPMPDGMTLMVPSDVDDLACSPLFSPEAIAAYRAEPTRAAELLAAIPAHDESVAEFTLRHFGTEVLERVAAPLLSGVFGGDVQTLSARATLPALIAMESTHGSLIAALAAHRALRNGQQTPLFSTLRTGLGTLTDRLTAEIPPHTVRLNTTVVALTRARISHGESSAWQITSTFAGRHTTETYDRVLLALPPESSRRLLTPHDPHAANLLPTEASSAVLVAFAFPDASRVPIPPGFGLLVPPMPNHTPAVSFALDAPPLAGTGINLPPGSEPRTRLAEHPRAAPAQSGGVFEPNHTPTLLQACTFVDQKFPHRVPPGGRLLRAYFSGAAAARLAACNNDEIAAIARLELARILHTHTHAATPLSGPTPTPLPEPLITAVRRLPASLPQYAVGHLDRIAELQARLPIHLPGLTLLGNSLHGVGIPDVIRDARKAAREIAEQTRRP